jgi:DNA repair protein RecN (Recombination protein N)
MLTHLLVRNLAVLDEVEVEFAGGFTALTGETGAGKSMLVDALSLVLGERAESSAVRQDAPRAEITAAFDCTDRPDLQQWLTSHDLDAEKAQAECRVRRVVTTEGRSRAYINDQPVALETLREFGEQLVEICGQNAHQSLRHRATQRELLDGHGDHSALVDACKAAHERCASIEAERNRLRLLRAEGDARRDLLSHQVEELLALRPLPGELAALEQDHNLVTHRTRIAEGLQFALSRLDDDEHAAAGDAIAAAIREVAALTDLDRELAPANELLEQAGIQLREAVDLIRRRVEALEFDPEHAAAVEERLAALQAAARKHRVDPGELARHTERLQGELAAITGAGDRLDSLEEQYAQARSELRSAATRLSAARRQAAKSLAAAVTANLHRLGMPQSAFRVDLQPLAGAEITANGADQIEFLIAPNPGQAAGPLARIASGGELSRISLAIQLVAMTRRTAATLIFDEVDAGVGGGVAEIVGIGLRKLSSQRQVLCVTHLPQVASQADQHFVVRKVVRADKTRTSLDSLEGAARVEEIARMLGGLKITSRTRAHADEMLKAHRRAG